MTVVNSRILTDEQLEEVIKEILDRFKEETRRNGKILIGPSIREWSMYLIKELPNYQPA